MLSHTINAGGKVGRGTSSILNGEVQHTRRTRLVERGRSGTSST